MLGLTRSTATWGRHSAAALQAQSDRLLETSKGRINKPSLLFRWRKLAKNDVKPAAPAFLPISLTAPAKTGETDCDHTTSEAPAADNRIEIELLNGRRVRVGPRRRNGRLEAHSRYCRREETMIPVPTGVRVWLATGHTDMRRGFPSLSLQVQEVLRRDPLSGHLFCFRGRRGDLLKVIWHDGQGACLFTKRLEKGRFLWPSPADGAISISPAQLGYLLSGIAWRNPQKTWRPTSVG